MGKPRFWEPREEDQEPPKHKVAVTVYLTREMAERLKALAARDKKTRTEICEHAIEFWLKSRRRTRTEDEL